MTQREFLDLIRELYDDGDWPKPLHRIRGAQLVDAGLDLKEVARTVGTNARSLRDVLGAADRLKTLLGCSVREVDRPHRERAIRTLGQLLVGRAAERAFEDAWPGRRPRYTEVRARGGSLRTRYVAQSAGCRLESQSEGTRDAAPLGLSEGPAGQRASNEKQVTIRCAITVLGGGFRVPDCNLDRNRLTGSHGYGSRRTSPPRTLRVPVEGSTMFSMSGRNPMVRTTANPRTSASGMAACTSAHAA